MRPRPTAKFLRWCGTLAASVEPENSNFCRTNREGCIDQCHGPENNRGIITCSPAVLRWRLEQGAQQGLSLYRGNATLIGWSVLVVPVIQSPPTPSFRKLFSFMTPFPKGDSHNAWFGAEDLYVSMFFCPICVSANEHFSLDPISLTLYYFRNIFLHTLPLQYYSGWSMLHCNRITGASRTVRDLSPKRLPRFHPRLTNSYLPYLRSTAKNHDQGDVTCLSLNWFGGWCGLLPAAHHRVSQAVGMGQLALWDHHWAAVTYGFKHKSRRRRLSWKGTGLGAIALCPLITREDPDDLPQTVSFKTIGVCRAVKCQPPGSF